jgi:hypothetical protein
MSRQRQVKVYCERCKGRGFLDRDNGDYVRNLCNSCPDEGCFNDVKNCPFYRATTPCRVCGRLGYTLMTVDG